MDDMLTDLFVTRNFESILAKDTAIEYLVKSKSHDDLFLFYSVFKRNPITIEAFLKTLKLYITKQGKVIVTDDAN